MRYLWETNKELINQLQRDSKLFHSPIHGFKHWRTVEKNGLYLSQFNDGDPKVISHFAYFHDCMRINDHRDDGHGIRGGRYALKNKELILLAGFQGYPTNISDNLISRLKYLDEKSRLYHQNFNIGFAPHPDTRDLNSLVSLVAIGAGARYLERHLTLGKVMKLEDYESALNPDEFSTYVKQIKRGFKAFGKSNSYELSIAEKKYRKGIRRDVVASINLKKGTVLSSKHLDLKRSSEKKGIKSLNDVYGQILKKDLNKNDVILKSYLK